jgi:hypothetical protein
MDAYVIVAELTVLPERLADFVTHSLEDARDSVANEPGCRQFDVNVAADCVHQIQMSLFLPFRNVTPPRWSGSGGGRARSPGVAQRPNGARSTAFETAPFVFTERA